MRSNANRAVAAVTAAAIALTTAGVAPAFAASRKAPRGRRTDFSSGHRYYGGGHGYRRNNAAGAAAFAAIVGGIAAYAAAREYRKSRERSYYNGYNGYGLRPAARLLRRRTGLLRQLVRPENATRKPGAPKAPGFYCVAIR